MKLVVLTVLLKLLLMQVNLFRAWRNTSLPEDTQQGRERFVSVEYASLLSGGVFYNNALAP